MRSKEEKLSKYEKDSLGNSYQITATHGYNHNGRVWSVLRKSIFLLIKKKNTDVHLEKRGVCLKACYLPFLDCFSVLVKFFTTTLEFTCSASSSSKSQQIVPSVGPPQILSFNHAMTRDLRKELCGNSFIFSMIDMILMQD